MNEIDTILSECINDFAPVGSGVKSGSGTLNELGEKLTLLGVKQLLPIVNEFLHLIGVQLPQIKHYDESAKNATTDMLKDLFDRHGSDKSVSHDYHLVYGEIFQKLDRNASLNILEIGLGSQNPLLPSRMSGEYTVGASIRVYKEFFPNAQVFGADIDKDTLFEEERIKTSYVDQLDPTTFEKMHDNFGSPAYDLIIEDGLHSFSASMNTLNFALKYTKNGGVIILEDLNNMKNIWNMIAGLLIFKGYNASLISSRGVMLVVYV